jgi:hypothetical protein
VLLLQVAMTRSGRLFGCVFQTPFTNSKESWFCSSVDSSRVGRLMQKGLNRWKWSLAAV